MSSRCPEWADGRRLPQGKQTRTSKIYYLSHHGSVGYFLDTVFRTEEWTLAALTDQSRPPSL